MPNIDETQALVNALQLQRNVALDNVATLSARLSVAEDRIKQLETTLDEINRNTDIPECVIA